MNIRYKTLSPKPALALAAVLTVSLLSLLTGTAHAAASLCAVTRFNGDPVVSTCAKANIPDPNQKKLLAAVPDQCFNLTITAPDPTHAQVSPPADCNKDPFASYKDQQITRDQNELNKSFNSCSTATNTDTNCVGTYINIAITFLAAGVGVVVIIMIIVGGIRYSAAGGDASKVAAAKTQIFNALLALVAFIFLFAFLQWLVPGGWQWHL